MNGGSSPAEPAVGGNAQKQVDDAEVVFTVVKCAAAPTPSAAPRTTRKTTPRSRNLILNIRSSLPAGALPVLAEFVSTALLVLVGCMSCAHSTTGEDKVPTLHVILAFGLTVMFNIQIFGHVSGAHMNPAVTLASVLIKRTPVLLGVAYVIVQCAGAIAGFGLLQLIMSEPGAYCHTDVRHITVFQGLMVEIVITVVLILVCCVFWDPANKDKTDSLAIKFGLTIAGLSLSAARFTGASMNPARSLGPAVWLNMWTNHWLYWVGPLVAAALASLLYRVLLETRAPPAAAPGADAEELPLSAREKVVGGAA